MFQVWAVRQNIISGRYMLQCDAFCLTCRFRYLGGAQKNMRLRTAVWKQEGEASGWERCRRCLSWRRRPPLKADMNSSSDWEHLSLVFNVCRLLVGALCLSAIDNSKSWGFIQLFITCFSSSRLKYLCRLGMPPSSIWVRSLVATFLDDIIWRMECAYNGCLLSFGGLRKDRRSRPIHSKFGLLLAEFEHMEGLEKWWEFEEVSKRIAVQSIRKGLENGEHAFSTSSYLYFPHQLMNWNLDLVVKPCMGEMVPISLWSLKVFHAVLGDFLQTEISMTFFTFEMNQCGSPWAIIGCLGFHATHAPTMTSPDHKFGASYV